MPQDQQLNPTQILTASISSRVGGRRTASTSSRVGGGHTWSRRGNCACISTSLHSGGAGRKAAGRGNRERGGRSGISCLSFQRLRPGGLPARGLLHFSFAAWRLIRPPALSNGSSSVCSGARGFSRCRCSRCSFSALRGAGVIASPEQRGHLQRRGSHPLVVFDIVPSPL